MKTFAAFAAGLFAASQLFAQTADKPVVITPTDLKPADSQAPAVKPPAKKDVKKPDAMGIIPGLTIPRANGTFLGLQIVEARFKLSFYDSKKKPMAVDVTRAVARWPNPRAIGVNHDVLNPSGNALVGFKTVVEPYAFNLTLVLLQGGDQGDDPKTVETFVIPFHG